MKVTIKGHIRHSHYSWEAAPRWTFYQSWDNSDTPPDDTDESVLVRSHSFVIEVPNNFNPIPQKVAALMARKQKVQADAHVEATKIEETIQKLLAIGYDSHIIAQGEELL